ncbi:MAG: hypothetical protein ACLTYN_15200 [Dysosmobacter welbionis]
MKWFRNRRRRRASVQLRETGHTHLDCWGSACAVGRSGCTGQYGRRCRWWTPPSTS